jgi:hypothetical protein
MTKKYLAAFEKAYEKAFQGGKLENGLENHKK